jgi:hypothetical protein
MLKLSVGLALIALGADAQTVVSLDDLTIPGFSTGAAGTVAWTETTGLGTPTAGTGPLYGAPSGATTWYYTETSPPATTGDIFVLAYDGSNCTGIVAGMGVHAVSFKYMMRGHQMGTLHVYDNNTQGGGTSTARDGRDRETGELFGTKQK